MDFKMLLQILLNDIDVLSYYDKDNYQPLEYEEIQAVSKQGKYNLGAAQIDGEWIPKSQMKCDFEKNLYVTLWFYSKLEKT